MTEHVQIQIPSGTLLAQGHCPTCEAAFGVIQPYTTDKYPLFCPFCSQPADFTTLEARLT